MPDIEDIKRQLLGGVPEKAEANPVAKIIRGLEKTAEPQVISRQRADGSRINVLRNFDGSESSERAGSVEHPLLNRGRPTLIPFINQETGLEMTAEEGIQAAIDSGLQYPAFDTNEEATVFATERSRNGSRLTQGDLGQPRFPGQIEILRGEGLEDDRTEEDKKFAIPGRAIEQAGRTKQIDRVSLFSLTPDEILETIGERDFAGKVDATLASGMQSFTKGLSSAPLKALAIAQKTFDDFRADNHKFRKKPIEEYMLFTAAKKIEKGIEGLYPLDPREEGKLNTDFGGAVGSLGAFLFAGGVTKAATGIPTVTAGMVGLTGAAQEGGALFDEARAAGISEEEQKEVFWLGAALGALEIIGEPLAAIRIFALGDKMTNGLFKKSIPRIIKEAGVAGVKEGVVEEGLQQGLGNEVAKAYYDKDRSFWDGLARSVGIGGVLGIFLNGAANVMTQGSRLDKDGEFKHLQDGYDPNLDLPPEVQQIAASDNLVDLGSLEDTFAAVEPETPSAVIEPERTEKKVDLIQEDPKPKTQDQLNKEAEAAGKTRIDISSKKALLNSPGDAGVHQLVEDARNDPALRGILSAIAARDGTISRDMVKDIPALAESSSRKERNALRDKLQEIARDQGENFEEIITDEDPSVEEAPALEVDTPEDVAAEGSAGSPESVGQTRIEPEGAVPARTAPATPKVAKPEPAGNRTTATKPDGQPLNFKEFVKAKGRDFSRMKASSPEAVQLRDEYNEYLQNGNQINLDTNTPKPTRESPLDAIPDEENTRDPNEKIKVSTQESDETMTVGEATARLKQMESEIDNEQAAELTADESALFFDEKAAIEKALAEPPKTVSPAKATAAEKARKELEIAKTKLKKKVDSVPTVMGTLGGNLSLKDVAELTKLATDVIGKYFKAKVYNWGEMLLDIAKQWGTTNARTMEPMLREAWEQKRKSNPKMTPAIETIDEMFEGTKDAPLPRTPPEGVPTDDAPTTDQLPDGTQHDQRSLVTRIMDYWIGRRDLATHNARRRSVVMHDMIMKSVGERRWGPKSRAAAYAIQLHVDLRRAPGDIDTYWAELTEEQKRVVQQSQTLNEEHTRIANQLVAFESEIGRRGFEAGVLMNYFDDHLSRIWDMEFKGQKRGKAAKFATKTPYGKQRKLSSILEGWAMGLELKVKDAVESHRLSSLSVEQAIYDKNMVLQAEKMGLLSHKQQEGWELIEHPNFKKWVAGAKITPELDEDGFADNRNWDPNVRVNDEGTVFHRVPMYGEPDIAKELNKRIKPVDPSHAIIQGIDEWNGRLKHIILTTSLFHFLAFTRSYMMGSRGVNPVTAYHEGKAAIEGNGAAVQELVKGGMTFDVGPDFDAALHDKKTGLGRFLDKIPGAKQGKDAFNAFMSKQTEVLFNYGAYLKVQAGLLEYTHLQMKFRKELASGKMTKHDIAIAVSKLMNNDFGGLNLFREGSSGKTQKWMRRALLAADWTMSNVRSMWAATGFKALNNASNPAAHAISTQIHREFWRRIVFRAAIANVLANFTMAAFDDDELGDSTTEKFFNRYARAWEAGGLKMFAVDVTPIARALGMGGLESREYWKLLGHFADPIKFARQPLISAKHKSSVVAGTLMNAMTGTDWRGRRFTTLEEFLGIDNKGNFKASGIDHRIGDPRGGKLAGRTVQQTSFGFGNNPITVFGDLDFTQPLFGLGESQALSFMANEAFTKMPVQMQTFAGFMLGEMNGYTALLRGLGIKGSQTLKKDPRKAITDHADRGLTGAARAALDRIAENESDEAVAGSAVKARQRYLGQVAMSASRPAVKRRAGEPHNEFLLRKQARDERSAEAANIVQTLDLPRGEILSAFRKAWRARGWKTNTDTYRRRRSALMRRIR